MRKLITSGFIITLLMATATAQQLGQFNMYLVKPALLNPAAAGIDKTNDVTLGFRNQWTGFPGAPRSFFLYAQYNANKKPAETFKQYSLRISDPSVYNKFQPDNKSKIRLYGSGLVMNDEHGFVSRTTAMLSLSGHTKLGDKDEYTVGAGLSFGMNNLKYDLNSLTVLNPETDNTYNGFVSYNESTIYLDMNFGLWVESSKFYAGYSALQVFGNSFPIGGSSSIYELEMHHYFMAGYKLALGDDDEIRVVPGILAGYTVNTFIKAVNVKVVYNDKYWGGITGNENYAGIIAGIDYKNFRFGYAFDMNLSGIRSYHAGSHELMLGLVL